MQHLILGYGYCGYYLAQELIRQRQKVQVVSRHLDKELELPQVTHHIQDIVQPFVELNEETYLYYLIPPPNNGETDTVLKQFLYEHDLKVKKVIYFSSSGVYGDHQGALVNEDALCIIQHARQLRRLDAEQRWTHYCQQKGMDLNILRVGGIFGPNRLPEEAAHKAIPVIQTQQAPLINHIYVRDLALIAVFLAQHKNQDILFNIADGDPQPMGTLQQTVAQSAKLKPASYETWVEAWDKASPMKKEFMNSSKRLNIERLKACLPPSFSFTSMQEAVRASLEDRKCLS